MGWVDLRVTSKYASFASHGLGPEQAERLAHDLVHGIGAYDALFRQVGFVRQRASIVDGKQLLPAEDPDSERVQPQALLLVACVEVHEHSLIAHEYVERFGSGVLFVIENHVERAVACGFEPDVCDVPLVAKHAIELGCVLCRDAVEHVVGHVRSVARDVVADVL